MTLHFTPLQNIPDLLRFLNLCVTFIFISFFPRYSITPKESITVALGKIISLNNWKSWPLRDSRGFCPFAFIKCHGEANSTVQISLYLLFISAGQTPVPEYLANNPCAAKEESWKWQEREQRASTPRPLLDVKRYGWDPLQQITPIGKPFTHTGMKAEPPSLPWCSLYSLVGAVLSFEILHCKVCIGYI